MNREEAQMDRGALIDAIAQLREELHQCRATIAALEAEAEARDLQEEAEAAFRDYVREAT